MKVLHVSPSFFPATYWGGPIYSTHELCVALSKLDSIELRVITTNSNGPSRGDCIPVEQITSKQNCGYDAHYFERYWGASVSPKLLQKLPKFIQWADLVHLTGVYSFPTIPTLVLCKLLDKPLIWSPRGSLQRWEHTSRLGIKRLWEMTCDYLCEKNRVTLHVTSSKERDDSLSRITRTSAAVVPNGVSITPILGNSRPNPDDSLRLLYLGRFDPIKGIENLLLAMKQLDSAVTLTICGNGGNGYAGNLKGMAENLDIAERVHFRGDVRDEEKASCFANSDVFVMPSFTESFGVSAAEALSYGIPVIVSKGTPWNKVEEFGCGLWVDNDPQSLTDAINRIRHMPRDVMGKRGRDWMVRDFSWDVIARRMMSVYQESLKRTHDR